MVDGNRRDLQNLCQQVERQNAHIDGLAQSMTSMRTDIQATAIAIDGHSTRLTHIEPRLENMELNQHVH